MPVRGVSYLRQRLNEARRNIEIAARDATIEAAEIVLQDQIDNAPGSGSGRVVESLGISFFNEGLGARIGQVDPQKARRGFMALFYERGTKGGPYEATNKRGKKYTINAPAIFARPFIAPSIQTKRAEIVATIRRAAQRAFR